MTRFKVVSIPGGGFIQFIIKGSLSEDLSKVKIDLKVLIKNLQDEDFHSVLSLGQRCGKVRSKTIGPYEGLPVSIEQIIGAVREFEAAYMATGVSKVKKLTL